MPTTVPTSMIAQDAGISPGHLSGSIYTVPSGVMFDFAGTAAPSGYLTCDGSAVSRTTYAALFAVVGTTWGVGDGSTTFNLPDFRRRVAVGSGGVAVSGPANTVGATGGEEAHTLTTSEMPSHSHALNGGNNYFLMRTSGGSVGLTTGTGLADTVQNTGTQGSGTAHNVMQPSAVVLKIIKT